MATQQQTKPNPCFKTRYEIDRMPRFEVVRMAKDNGCVIPSHILERDYALSHNNVLRDLAWKSQSEQFPVPANI